jgi:hypothetical protein
MPEYWHLFRTGLDNDPGAPGIPDVEHGPADGLRRSGREGDQITGNLDR